MTLQVLYWSSKTKNTERFVNRLGCIAARIDSDTVPAVSPFILAMPTYSDGSGRGAVPKPVIRFLNQEQNRSRLVGIIGSGNRNFGEMYGIGAKIVAAKCQVPLLYLFELSGTDADIFEVRKRISSL